MELKWGYHNGITCIANVWIEPLWNWNMDWLVATLHHLGVWIEPLWNWNPHAACTSAARFARFELNLYGIEMPGWSAGNMRPAVWIEPLWNWNGVVRHGRRLQGGLNWTFMELKLWSLLRMCATLWFELNLYGIEIIICPNWQNFYRRLNWTFMELKLIIYKAVHIVNLVWIEPLFMELKSKDNAQKYIDLHRLNWTFMELKLMSRAEWIYFTLVWIEPLWNWNIDGSIWVTKMM